jgi:ABC-type antimicrobial peptide transport system permease subunit
LAASPLGGLFFIGLACDVSDIDDWIKKNNPASLLHLWRVSAWLFGFAFALASALIFTFHVSVWLESFFLSQIIGVGAVLALIVAYYIARLFRLTE